MARLTGYDENGNVFSKEEKRVLNANGLVSKDEMYKIMMHLAERLAYYEDLDDQGKLIIQPCKVGDTLYCDGKHFATCHEDELHHFTVSDIVTEIRHYFHGETDYYFDFADVGKTVFLTEKEAKDALGK